MHLLTANSKHYALVEKIRLSVQTKLPLFLLLQFVEVWLEDVDAFHD